jgi:hypothetical protein
MLGVLIFCARLLRRVLNNPTIAKGPPSDNEPNSDPRNASAIGKARLGVQWLAAPALLVVVFLIINEGLLSGACVQIWDAWSFYTPAFSLVADHAHAGRLLRWNPRVTLLTILITPNRPRVGVMLYAVWWLNPEKTFAASP